MIKNIAARRRISFVFIFAAVLTICIFSAAEVSAVDVWEIPIGKGTVDSGKTLGSPDFLTANWYSTDSSVIRITGQNYNTSVCSFEALKSSEGEIVSIYVEYQYELTNFPYVPGVYTDRIYFHFIVLGDPPTSVSLPETAEITDDSYVTLEPTVYPSDAEKSFTWSSSDTSVAEVSQDGVVRGVSKGTAVITVETHNGLTAQCVVTVKSSHPCGDDLEWDYSFGRLTISGTGDMYDYSDDAPWQAYSEDITEIVVSEGVTSIGDYAFAYTNASSVTLPESLLSIGEEAFAGCNNLESIYIPGGVANMDGDPFASYSLREIIVSPDNMYYSSHDGVLFDKDMTTLVRYPAGRENSVWAVPGYVDTIAFAAFYGTGLESLYVPETVTTVEYMGISGIGLTVYGHEGSEAERAVEEYNSLAGDTLIYFVDISESSPMLVSVGNAVGGYSDTVSLPVVLSGNTGFANLNIEISYDSSVLELKSARGEDFGALYTEGAGTVAGVYSISWDAAENISYNGTIATLEFEIIDEDFEGLTPVGLSFYKGLDGNYTDGLDVNYDAAFEPLILGYMNGSVAPASEPNSISLENINTDGEGISLTARLSSEEAITGTVVAAIYDREGQLKAVKLYNAAETVDIAFEDKSVGSQLAVMWLDSVEGLQPMAAAQRIDIGE